MFCSCISIFLILVHVVISWDLSSYGVENDHYVSSIAVYKSRAFLSLPRSVCHNNESGPTLIETHWTGDIFHSSSNLLSGRQKILDHQKRNECGDIQDAISLDVEAKRHLLWILDKGNVMCEPKVVSFNLFYNVITEIKELKNIPSKHLNAITIDPVIGQHGHKAYISRPGLNEILVFSLNKLTWWKLLLSEPNNPLKIIKPDFLAVSKTSPQLFMSNKDDEDLFVLGLEDLRESEEQVDEVTKQSTVTLIGKELGMSSCMETDYKSGLIYFMIRDYAIVRWKIGTPLRAEFHNVLVQSYEDLPYVSQLFTDPQKGIWALVNNAGPEECSVSTSNETNPVWSSRVIRILRYNIFRNEIESE